MLLRWIGYCGIALSVGLGFYSGHRAGTGVTCERGTVGGERVAGQDPVEPSTRPGANPSGAGPTGEPAAPEGVEKVPVTSKPQVPGGRELPPVRRAKRPTFQPRDWDGVYFENLFREGLVGPRPQPGDGASPRPAVAGAGSGRGSQTAKDATADKPLAGGTWASVVPGEAIESEVKRLQLQLEQDLTTPIKFKTDYLKVRQSYSLLSMWFAIIFEYDGDVRWKQAAAIVQPACWRAAANARTDGEQAYQYARLRKEELKELIRGGSFGDSEKPIDAVDWAQVVDRVPTMVQLEASLTSLKAFTASKSEFQGSVDDVVQQAAVIAAIGKVLANEAMEGGDDEGYRSFAGEMQSGATSLLDAVKLNDYDSASGAVNRIEQSCNKCHEDWR